MFSEDKETIFLDSNKEIKADEFNIPNYRRDEWNVSSDKHWKYMIYKHKDFPDQGWKIHITTSINDSEKLLYDVSLFLIENQISFKYVPNKTALINKNSKYSNRSSSGKFLTIYPYEEWLFLELLDELKEITDLYDEGPYILNDKQWKMSNVFFRYGGMKNIYTLSNGERKLSIKDTEGNFVADQRVPYYYLPEFIKEPNYLEKNNIFPEDQYFQKFDDFKILKALHHSNAGGVYLIEKNNKRYILKEGRRGAGIDAKLKDGFSRINDEYYFLSLLSNIDGVIDIHEKFNVWSNNYLIEEYFDGVSLQKFIAKNFPLAMLSSDRVKNNYLKKVEKIFEKLSNIILEIHNAGVGLGDFSLNNILIDEQSLELKIIDLEAADFQINRYMPSLSTPGFTDTNSVNYRAGDIFALKRILRSLLLPTTHLLDLSNDLMVNHDATIGRIFGIRATNLLDKYNVSSNSNTRQMSTIYLNTPLKTPNIFYSMDNLNDIIEKILCGIKKNLNFDSLSLFPGNIEQYTSLAHKYNVTYGAFGVALSILRLNTFDIKLNEQLVTWIKNMSSIISQLYKDKNINFGLFNGVGGIITVLYESKNYEIMNELIELVSTDLKTNIDSNEDISLYSGLSGIGLLFLSLHNIYGDKEYLSLAEQISQKIQMIYEETTDKNRNDFGLMSGWSGAALFLWKYGEEINSEKIQEISICIMDDFLYFINEETDYELLFDNSKESGYIIDPYFKDGLTGILLVLIEMIKGRKDYLTLSREKKFKKISHHALIHISADAGLFKGYVGVSLFLNAYSTIFNKTQLSEHMILNLSNYLVSDDYDNVYTPGPYGIKISLNYANGSAGLLLVLKDLNHDRWNTWLPLPKSKLKIFEW